MDFNDKPPNPHDEWTVDATVLRSQDGVATVEIHWRNGSVGALPPFTVEVPWMPGSERRDVESHALRLAGQSANFLFRAFFKAAADRVV